MSTDPDHKFDLAISLNDLETALALVRAAPPAGSEAKWKVVGDKALAAWQMDLAQESFEKANDLPALLLLFTSLSDRAGLERLAKLAQARGQNNIAFASYLQLGDTQSCISLLAATGRIPEAAIFARSYQPGAMAGLVGDWKGELEGVGRGKIAATIANPDEDQGLFSDMGENGDGEGSSGVMVEKEDAEGADADGEVAEANGAVLGISEKVGEAVESVKEPVEDLAQKVKEMAVGKENGDGTEGECLSDSTCSAPWASCGHAILPLLGIMVLMKFRS